MRVPSDFLVQLKKVELALKPLRGSAKNGLHPLSFRGHSVDFAEYREYRQGDELRHLDWKVFARSDRYYVKQRESQNPGIALILLDDSLSMSFQSEEASVSKFRAALLLVFGLTYLLHRQGDAFSFHCLYSQHPPMKPRSSKAAFRHILQQLQQLDQQGASGSEQITQLPWQPASIDQVYLISDFMFPSEHWESWTQMAQHLAPNLTFFRVLDPQELNPKMQSQTIKDIEQREQKRYVSAEEWQGYLKQFEEHHTQLKRFCLHKNISYRQLNTIEPTHQSIYKALQ